MKEPLECPNCHSRNIKKSEDKDDFLALKLEGCPAKKMVIKKKQRYFCWDCESIWEEDIKI